ncbi:MAG: hypothetical protein M3P84_08015 [Chloroflexota bacterium]|nr:hypothetical protein [Chloroflexota bacterium]
MDPSGSSGGGPGYWPALAIIAVIIATAGWTTVGVLVVNDRPAVASGPIESDEAIDDEEEIPDDEPQPESHLFPDLEALLPTEAAGTQLAAESITGTDFLPDDGSVDSVIAYLTSVGKTPADVQAALTGDPEQRIDLDSVWVYRLAGVAPEGLRDALIEGVLRANFPEIVMAPVTVGDKAVVLGAIDGIYSTWYIHDGLLFEIESFDEDISTAILAGLPPAEAVPSAAAPSAAESASPAP